MCGNQVFRLFDILLIALTCIVFLWRCQMTLGALRSQGGPVHGAAGLRKMGRVARNPAG